jgi:flavodoxin
MRALIVVESVFGNTRAVADAVAEGLATSMRVDVVDVGVPGTIDAGVDLLVVGGPMCTPSA